MGRMDEPKPQTGAESGFTVVEVVIAIAIFSFLIIFCLGMFISVGRIYYRGLYENQTQEVARSIVDNISESLSSSGRQVHDYHDPASPDPAGWKAYCIGGIQYSYKLNVQLVTESAPLERQSGEVFIVSDDCNPPGSNISAPPPDCNATPPPTPPCANRKVELMHENMRLLEFVVRPRGRGLHDVEVKIALGGDMSDLEFDSEVFRYVDQASATPEDEVDPTDAAYANQTNWDTMTMGPAAPDQYYNNNGPGLTVNQCQAAETFCALIDFKTKVFRRVL